MWGPARVDGVSQFPIYRDLGVGIWQTKLSWRDVATRRPARPDRPVRSRLRVARGARRGDRRRRARHGIAVSLLVMRTPAWANGGRVGPLGAALAARLFADFLTAAARRYPGVRHWMIWGEPTKASNFQPLRPDRGRRAARARGAATARASTRACSIAAYGALQGRRPGATVVIGGNTFTVGTVSPLPLDPGAAAARRPAAADGPLRPQPVLRPAPAALAGPARPRLRRLRRPRHAGALARPLPARRGRAGEAQAVPVRDSASRPTTRTSSSTSS